MLGMEQLQHGRIHFATADEAFFGQPIQTKINIHPRQTTKRLRSFNIAGLTNGLGLNPPKFPCPKRPKRKPPADWSFFRSCSNQLHTLTL